MLASGLVSAATPAGTSATEADCPNADATVHTAAAPDLAAATLCLVNAERAAAGRSPLATHETLSRTAQSYASEMVATSRFAHTDLRGGSVADRVLSAGGSLDPWLELGENLGWGTLTQGTPRALVAGWMNSPLHRDNVLYSTFNQVGLGIADGIPVAGGSEGMTYVAVFGRSETARTQTAPPRPVTKKKAKRCSKKRPKTRRAARKARACRARARR